MVKIIARDTKDRYNEILKDMNLSNEKEFDRSKSVALYRICAREYL